MEEDRQSPPGSPPPPPSPPSSPAQPPHLPPTPPLPPQSPPLPPPSQQPDASPANHGDGGVGTSEVGGDGSGGVGDICGDAGGAGGGVGGSKDGGDGGDAGGVDAHGGDAGGVDADGADAGGVVADGHGEGEDEEDDDDDERIDFRASDFRNIDVDENTHGIEFLYNVFDACTPNFPLNTDNIWQPSMVAFKDYQGVISARVNRRPTPLLRCFLGRLEPVLKANLTFDVYLHCNFLRYILRQSWSGLVVVKVEALHEPEDGDWSKTAQIRRIMSTKHALKECEEAADEGSHLGKKSLETFQTSLEDYQRDHKQWTVGKEVYHESDVVEDVDVRELIGVVRWYPFRASEAPGPTYFKAPYDYPKADLIYIGESFRQTIRTAKQKRIRKQSGRQGRGKK